MSTNATRPRPVHEIRLGRVRAAVWENPSDNGVRHSVTLCRLYKEGDQWHSGGSFRRDDLPLVAKVSDLAHSWIFAQRDDGDPPDERQRRR